MISAIELDKQINRRRYDEYVFCMDGLRRSCVDYCTCGFEEARMRE